MPDGEIRISHYWKSIALQDDSASMERVMNRCADKLVRGTTDACENCARYNSATSCQFIVHHPSSEAVVSEHEWCAARSTAYDVC